ncbi:hypothetical protein P3X46_022091 [Hevea brasiliensis]|uniref:Uncharacterized protein n=1 Tax=Hevea brasiliensis TaxID=3981 RepID=A0ABQ9LHK1_HEVBR|nr:uncharacterized protein LOC131171448 [Hevea brasiliensis]KAJ9167437.1 hypothetical protein P3X46_022091 [Hevea brasiliensis]
MNATSFSTPRPNFIEDNSGSDSDTNRDAAPQHYQPISAIDVDDDEDGSSDQGNSDEEYHSYSRGEAENGISSLHINGDMEQKSSSSDEEEAEERVTEASDSAILRAFREDENRRNAPLTAENARRVREAMRGISFGGSAPDWAGRVPEDEWINQLRRLRQPPGPSTSVQN